MTDIIWKLNPELIKNMKNQDTNLKKLYFCTPCCKYVRCNKFKSFLIKDENPIFIDFKNGRLTYTKCYICERMIQGIIKGPDIMNMISYCYKYEDLEDSLLIKLGKIKVWYYHDIYDNFSHDLINKFKIDIKKVKNMYRLINELYGLPSELIINSKAEDITKFVLYGVNNNYYELSY